jgi:hypothetical protein
MYFYSAIGFQRFLDCDLCVYYACCCLLSVSTAPGLCVWLLLLVGVTMTGGDCHRNTDLNCVVSVLRACVEHLENLPRAAAAACRGPSVSNRGSRRRWRRRAVYPCGSQASPSPMAGARRGIKWRQPQHPGACRDLTAGHGGGGGINSVFQKPPKALFGSQGSNPQEVLTQGGIEWILFLSLNPCGGLIPCFHLIPPVNPLFGLGWD